MKKLGFGMMRLPTENGDNSKINFAHTNAMFDKFIEHGFNYFDTAYIYHNGMSEECVKDALVKRHKRDSFLVADKMPTFRVTSAADYDKIFDVQLKRCGVEYFDYYLLHSLNRANYESTQKFGGFEYVQKLKKACKVRRAGFSYHDDAQLLDQILTEHPEMEFVQLQINYIDWEDAGIQSRLCYEVARHHNKPIIVMEPVKGGSLARIPDEVKALLATARPDLSPAAWAIKFAASLPGVIMVLSGMSNMEQLNDNLSYMTNFEPLTNGERDILDRAERILSGKPHIPCTSCRYCVDECPKKIPIPELFSIFNDRARFGYAFSQESYYEELTKTHGKASDCIACKRCERHCPQHIEIAARIKDVSKIVDKD